MNEAVDPVRAAELRAAMEHTVAAALLDCTRETVRWNYENGLVLKALWECSERHMGGRLAGEIGIRMDALVDQAGRIAGYRDDEYNLDQVNPGVVLFDLWSITGKPQYRTALETLDAQLRSHPRTPSGSYWHKKIYPDQVWLDGLYMFGPFVTRYAAGFGDAGRLDDLCAQLLRVRDTMRSDRTALYRHARDESRRQGWADPADGRSPHVWGRAVGWLAMALVDILERLPATHPGREPLIQMSADLARESIRLQDRTGLWFQLPELPDAPGNYRETSVTCMFAYAFAKSSRLGLYPPELARSCAASSGRAVEGVLRRLRVDDSGRAHLGGICKVAGLGGMPYRDGSIAYYCLEPVVEDDYKGTGPFLLALCEQLG